MPYDSSGLLCWLKKLRISRFETFNLIIAEPDVLFIGNHELGLAKLLRVAPRQATCFGSFVLRYCPHAVAGQWALLMGNRQANALRIRIKSTPLLSYLESLSSLRSISGKVDGNRGFTLFSPLEKRVSCGWDQLGGPSIWLELLIWICFFARWVFRYSLLFTRRCCIRTLN